MATSEMGGKIEILLKQNQRNRGEEKDTVVECEPVGIIPEEKLKLSSPIAQKDLDQETKGPEAKPFLRRDVGGCAREETGDSTRERKRGISK